MNPTVSVKFKKNRDYSNAHKNTIIYLLPGPLRIDQEKLNDMDQGGVHTFEFQNIEVARKFAIDLFLKLNSVLDVTTNFNSD